MQHGNTVEPRSRTVDIEITQIHSTQHTHWWPASPLPPVDGEMHFYQANQPYRPVHHHRRLLLMHNPHVMFNVTPG